MAVGLYITASFQAPPWETRLERLGLEQNFATDSWVSNADNIFENFTLLRNPGLIMRGAVETLVPGSATLLISELEEVLDQMVDGMSTRGLLELPDEQKSRVFLRALTTAADGELTATIQPECVVGELVDDETVNPELVIESRFFSFCPLASNSRLTFLESSYKPVISKCPSTNKWDRCVVRLGECFAHHSAAGGGIG